MYQQPTPEAGAPSALGVPRKVPNGGPKAPGCGCGPGGTGRGWPAWKSWDEPGHGENRRWGSCGPPGEPWGTHRSGAQSPGSRRLSQPGPGLLVEGEITCSVGRRRRLVPRAAALIPPSPTNEIKGVAQSGSLQGAPWQPFLKRARARDWAGLLPSFSFVPGFSGRVQSTAIFEVM